MDGGPEGLASGLRKDPGLVTTVVLTVAIGIGATTAIFRVADPLVGRLPVADPQDLVSFQTVEAQSSEATSVVPYSLYERIRESPFYSGVFAAESDELWERLLLNETGRVGRGDPASSAMRTLRGSVIGTLCGLLPGSGATLASFLSYFAEKRFASDPSRFGRGAIEGVAAPEAANNAAVQAAFIPTLTLGIPGDAVMASLLGAMLAQGVAPGPGSSGGWSPASGSATSFFSC